MSKLIHYFKLILFGFLPFYISAYAILNKLIAVFFTYNYIIFAVLFYLHNFNLRELLLYFGDV